MIKDCLVTVEDIDIAEEIFAKDILYLKGKTVQSKPKQVRYDIIEIPPELKLKHQEVQLHINVLYINGIAFLSTIGHPIYYQTCY